MKSSGKIKHALVWFAFLYTISRAASAATLTNDQLIALVDRTIVPLVQSYATATNNIAFDVVIIENADLRKELSKKYVSLNKWLKFEPKDAVTFEFGKSGGVNVLRATGKMVNANTFKVISDEKGRCLVRWFRILSSVDAFTKIVTLVYRDNKWVVVDVKLETVS